ncbi:hypothetical protein A3C37_04560 [Candidatus Peribacteria bacterium RIFCSPHIGHO2_02_FULL_53_20]|nr:MAG: hypothetical protein A3C37_04560 [Candidatus Peribacteria bacterium RIFCSPHIGHO2_02_FULL_53_20]OGJ74494.1 MAG: hypothetical protein A3G69_00645 [Candidatus Peribacteria bacterium RIFCSPLOWO2_12_FULL_53_10]
MGDALPMLITHILFHYPHENRTQRVFQTSGQHDHHRRSHARRIGFRTFMAQCRYGASRPKLRGQYYRCTGAV